MTFAKSFPNGNMKDEKTLNEVIDTLSGLTGKPVSDEKRKKIIDKIVNDKVPKCRQNVLKIFCFFMLICYTI